MRGVIHKMGAETVDTIMTKRPITVKEDITADEAINMMYAKKVERLPVVDEKGKLIGIITMQDLLEKQQFPNANRDKSGNLRVAAAVGPFDMNRAMMLAEAGADAIIVDCAHGHNMHVVQGVKDIKGSVSCDVIAGNIATAAAARELVDFVDGIKVGIGPGSICTTRIVAGVGVPQVSAIANVCDIADPAGVPVIADGGVKYSGDVAKAIVAGASSVMMGSMFAGTDEFVIDPAAAESVVSVHGAGHDAPLVFRRDDNSGAGFILKDNGMQTVFLKKTNVADQRFFGVERGGLCRHCVTPFLPREFVFRTAVHSLHGFGLHVFV